MTELRPGGNRIAVAAVVAGLLLSYVGAYSWKVHPCLSLERDPEGEIVPFYDWDHDEANERWTAFFAPIHWIDRRIRPQVWGE